MLGQNFVLTPREGRDRVSHLGMSVVPRTDFAKLEVTSKKLKRFSRILCISLNHSVPAACGEVRFIGGSSSFRMAP